MSDVVWRGWEDCIPIDERRLKFGMVCCHSQALSIMITFVRNYPRWSQKKKVILVVVVTMLIPYTTTQKGGWQVLNKQQSSCKKISTKLEKLWDVKLYPIEDMPSIVLFATAKQSTFSIPIQSVNALFVRDLNTALSVSSSSLPPMIFLVVLCSVSIVKYWMMKDGTYRRRQQYQQL